ncbi:hypothetical protein EV359DRAFT_82761 [Lentinula novae-zelandiae]|nr:hypothetical protein EV359DRAFT_82761 [Lentinula novae-zelandiae]
MSFSDSVVSPQILPQADSTTTPERRPCSILDPLGPPSPILAPAVLTATMTSEEVPMFLFNSESNDDIASRRASTVSSLDSYGLISSRSSDTIQTARTCSTYGTFGQFRRSQLYNTQIQTLSSPSPARLVSDNHGHTVMHDDPTKSLTSYSLEGYRRESTSGSLITTATLLSTTPIVSPPSPSPSVYSTMSCSISTLSDRSHETQYMNYSGYAGDLHSMSNLPAVSLSQCDSVISLPNLTVSRSCHDIKDSSASSSYYSRQAPLPSQVVSAPVRMSPHAELPRNLGWLRDTVVEILIDQEGFRSITPTFRFAGYSTNTRSLDSSKKVIEGGAAQFVPISRQTFNFHYAPFDGQPVLRRISINGSSRDHVSRQATMCLKSNGVYIVRGSETSIIPAKEVSGDSSTEAPKLRWKLDYFVDDRRGSGRREGEKTFTPLTFSCSPLLLHPLQGKKIRLMHVMKKNVVTKLVAERMELPNATSRRSSSPLLCEAAPSSPPPLTRTDPSKAHLWNLHRRFQSHGHPRTLERSESSGAKASSPLGSNRMNGFYNRGQQSVSQRHRRASSAGEICVTDLNQGYQNVDEKKGIKACNGDPVFVLSSNRLESPTIPYDRHILPPSKLSELLENIENVKPMLQKVEVFTSLSPAPRNPKVSALK